MKLKFIALATVTAILVKGYLRKAAAQVNKNFKLFIDLPDGQDKDELFVLASKLSLFRKLSFADVFRWHEKIDTIAHSFLNVLSKNIDLSKVDFFVSGMDYSNLIAYSMMTDLHRSGPKINFFDMSIGRLNKDINKLAELKEKKIVLIEGAIFKIEDIVETLQSLKDNKVSISYICVFASRSKTLTERIKKKVADLLGDNTPVYILIQYNY